MSNNIRYGRTFGEGTLLGDYDLGKDFLNKSPEQQARELAWSHACPIPEEVMKDFTTDWTINRYAECNFVFKFVTETAKDLNKPLYDRLMSPVKRNPDEPLLHDFPSTTPESLKEEMSPMTTPVGYALPRIIIEQMGRGENNCERTQERILKALDIVYDAITSPSVTTPVQLLVSIAEEISKHDANPEAVLSHMISLDILEEENCLSMYKDILTEMRVSAPYLYGWYMSLDTNKRAELKIVDLKEDDIPDKTKTPRIIKVKDVPIQRFDALSVQSMLNVENMDNVSVAVVRVQGENKKIINTRSDAVYVVTSGSGYFYINGEQFAVEQGDVIFIPRGTPYQDTGDLVMVSFNNPRYSPEYIVEV